MTPVVDVTAEPRSEGVAEIVAAVGRGALVVLPTDTVYGIGCDAFSPEAVSELLAAKGRGRDMPPPVLVGGVEALDGLARGVAPWVRRLVEEFWPGPLTLVLAAQPSLHWDLGDSAGTVALRMPDDEIALAVLEQTGPMAVTSANLTGQPAATSVVEAATQLGAAVEVYADGGPRGESAVSTILDCTGEEPVMLREGALSMDAIRAVIAPDPTPDQSPDPEAGPTPDPALNTTPDPAPGTTTDPTPDRAPEETP